MPTPERVRVRTASDYAVLKCGELEKFYYGYEFGKDADGDAVWGFRHTSVTGARFERSYAAMAAEPGCPDQFEPQDCLLFGIGLWLMEG